MAHANNDTMWHAPVNRQMRVLDRAFFRKTLPLNAARVLDRKMIAQVRTALVKSKDALIQERLGSVVPDPDASLSKMGSKCVLLQPLSKINGGSAIAPDSGDLELNGQSTVRPYSATLNELIKQGLITIVPYNLELDYGYWTYHDIMSAILPEDEQGEIPSGFSQVGHVAHLNLRDEYLKYKHLIAEIIMDKNPGVRTVINKIDDVGEESEYRTFKYEVLAGPDDLNVTISEESCTFAFDYSKVYWNSRLNTEHNRLVALFKEGDAVCDVMAGIGPFAVPAGKKGIFVWANDLNPDSFQSLQTAITRNKVQDFVYPFNEDGRTFIRTAVKELSQSHQKVDILKKPSRNSADIQPEIIKTLHRPQTFQHFVMNLPATATNFLPSFIGIYPTEVRQHLPEGFELPLIHVYCFSTKSADNVEEGIKICEEISRQLQYPMYPGQIEDGHVEIYDVRDVAPKKRMFCASFRLPKHVAFLNTS